MSHTRSDHEGRQHRWGRRSLEATIEAMREDPEGCAKRTLRWGLEVAKMWEEAKAHLHEVTGVDPDDLPRWDADGNLTPVAVLDLSLNGYQEEEIRWLLKYEPDALKTER